MWTQAVAIGVIAGAGNFALWVAAMSLLGVGTALVYPTLLAAVGDPANLRWTGEIELVGDEIHGLAVHEASRILKVPQVNEVLVSATTADLVRDGELSFEDRGQHELRGLNDHRHLFAVTEHT